MPIVLGCTLLIAVGCNSLPPGDVARLMPQAAATSTQPAQGATPRIVLIRGWRDLWSDGVDRLADRLRTEGLSPAVFKESQWQAVGDALLAGRGDPAPVVLIGFSYGADDVIAISDRLGRVGRSVELLVLIDPVTPGDIPANVARCVNFHQSNGAWDIFPWLRGVPVRDSPSRTKAGRVSQNIDLRARPDLLTPDTSHKTIAGNAKVHEAIVSEVVRLSRRDDPQRVSKKTLQASSK